MQSVLINNETAEISLDDIWHFSGMSIKERTSTGESETMFAPSHGDGSLREILARNSRELSSGLFI